MVLMLLLNLACLMTEELTGESRNAADKTTAGLKDFQRQLRDSGGF